MPRVVAVVGPTATGKSALAIDLARRLGGEVVNADSMQLYRGMDIGTAKLAPSERHGVPHHLLDIWPVTQTASVADYQRRGRECIDGLLARGVTPVLAGGSGLYIRALLDRIEFPAPMRRFAATSRRTSPASARRGCTRGWPTVDPAAASAIAPANGRKIVRALEVIALTGRPFTATLPAYDAEVYDSVHIGLDLPAARLDERLESRVAEMFEQGLVAEVHALERDGLRHGVTSSRALGYAQVLAALDGRIDIAEAPALTAQATRRFVRRQRSWFRRDPRIRWFDPASGAADLADRVAASIAE